MLIAQIVNNVEITVAEHYVLFPNTSFSEVGPTPDFMEQHGCYPVTVWKPHDPDTEKLVQAEPYLQDGEVFTVQVEDLTDEEIAANLASVAAKVRAQRNQLLKDADWSQGKDIPDAVSAPWATYRQQLRDLPDQAGFPKTVTWPTPPGAN
jgi:hypothetical protein